MSGNTEPQGRPALPIGAPVVPIGAPKVPTRPFIAAPLVAPERPRDMSSFDHFWPRKLDEEALKDQLPRENRPEVFRWAYETYRDVKAFAGLHADGKYKFLTRLGHEFYIAHRFKFPSVVALQETAEYVRTSEGTPEHLDEVERVMRWIHYTFRYIAWWDLQPSKRIDAEPTESPTSLKRKREGGWDIQQIENAQRSRYQSPKYVDRYRWETLCLRNIGDRLPD